MPRCAGAVVVLLVACGGSGTPDPTLPDSGSGGDGGGGGGTWTLEQITRTDGTISHSGQLAFTASGEPWVAFSEPPVGATGAEDLMTTSFTGGAWTTPEARNADSPFQQAFASLQVDGEVVHLVWSGRLTDAGVNDIYYARYEAGAWSAAQNLTNLPDSPTGLGDYSPVLTLGPGGALAVAFLTPADGNNGPAEVKVGTVNAGVLGDLKTAIPSVGSGCFAPTMVADQTGVLHLAADCGPLFAEDVYYTNNSAGSFAAAEKLPGNDGHDDGDAALALDPDGFTVHIAWRQDLPCGTSTCGEIVYSKRSNAQFAAPVAASGGATASEGSPTLAVAAGGRIYLGYQRANAANFFDVFVAHSDDGVSFGEDLLTPGTDGSDEWEPQSLVIDPAGKPELTYVQIVGGTNPLNAEIWRASL